jgi:mannose-1-phosphate guanylyltransferase
MRFCCRKSFAESFSMRAMVLAAGLGTRLRPLTDDRPKALVEVGGRSLLEITLARLHAFGIHDVIVNVHHFADKVISYLAERDNFGMHIEVSREDVLLDTGGGLKKASWFLLEQSGLAGAEPFLVHNVDVVSTIDLQRMVQFHRDNKALATLAVQHRETSRYLLFDEQLQLCGRQVGRDAKPEIVRAAPKTDALAFSGIHVISPRLLTLMKKEGVFSIIDTYLRLAGSGEKILAFRADDYYWRDLGKPADLQQAARDLEQGVFSA